MSNAKKMARSFAVLLLAAHIQTAAAQSAAAQPTREQIFDQIMADEIKLGSSAWRDERVSQSPRRHAMASIDAGGRSLQAWITWPQQTAKAPVVVMIPEDQGLNAWARDMADQMAAMGVIVVVPDMLSGMGPGGGGRASFPGLRSIFEAFSSLPGHEEPRMTADLNRWADYALHLPEANGRLAVAGFAWGGGRALWFATQRHDLSAAYVFYDAAPPADALVNLTAPVYGFYAENDPRVTRSLPATAAAMAQLHKVYEPVVYPGSDHMFMRLGEEPRDVNQANVTAHAQGLLRLQSLIAKLTG